MGLLDGMLGNAAKIDPAKIQQEFSQILAKGEVVEHAYQLICDYFLFTDGASCWSISRHDGEQDRLPLHSLQEHHALQCGDGGHLRSRCGAQDLDLWDGCAAVPIQKQFNKKLSIYEVQSVLASYVLR